MNKHKEICDAMVDLVVTGLNRGASGNVSVRDGDDMLISPSGVPPRELTPDMVARMPLAGDGEYVGDWKPSVEWRFHRDILRARPEMNAVVHTHAQWSTVLACARRTIPAVHYMIAAFGGPEIPLADYATYGSPELSENVLKAMAGHSGCLKANHGMDVAGDNLGRAMWLANELEALAHQHYHTLLLGGAAILTQDELDDTLKSFASYGKKSRGDAT